MRLPETQRAGTLPLRSSVAAREILYALATLTGMTCGAIEALTSQSKAPPARTEAIIDPLAGIPALESLREGNSLFDRELRVSIETMSREELSVRTIRFFLTRDDAQKRILLQIRPDEHPENKRTFLLADVPFLGMNRNPYDFIDDIRIGGMSADPRSTEIVLPIKQSALPRPARRAGSNVYSVTSLGDIESLVATLADAREADSRLSIPGKTRGLPRIVQAALDRLPIDHEAVTLWFTRLEPGDPLFASASETILSQKQAAKRDMMAVLLPKSPPSR